MAQFMTVCESLPFSQREVQVREIGPRSEEAVEPPCFAITGHHRSGTSLIASLLQSAGLDIGERLMPANEYNKRGYFEDLDFYEFQVAVLRAQGFHDAGYILQPSVSVPAQLAFGLGDLLQKRKRAGRPWGWKEPRSTLFLDFWHEQLPQLNFLLLFRAPWEVVDSLFRRGDENFLKNPSMAVRVWLNYNRVLLDFYDRHPERCLLLESYVVAREPSRLIEAIARKFGHHFGPIEDLYDKELYTHHKSPQYQALLACCFPEAIEVYNELRSKAEITTSAEFPSHSCDTPVSATADWALQPWIDCRIAEKELKHCRTELAQKEAALKQRDTVLEQTLAAQQQLLTERDNLRTQTHQLREQLELSQQQHQAAQAQIQELESCCLKLQDTVAEQALAAQQQLQMVLKQQDTVLEQTLAAQQQLVTERDNLRTQTHQLREQLELSQQQHQTAQTQIQELESCCLKLQDTVAEQALAASDNLRTQTHLLREQLELSQQQHQAAQAQIQELESCRLKLQDTMAEQALAAQQQLQMVLKQQDTVSEQTLAAQQQLVTERDNLRTQTHLLREQLELSQQQHQTAQAQIQELESCRLKLQDTVAEQALAASDNLRTQTHLLREQLELSQQQHQAAQLRIQDMENSRFWKLRGWWKRLRHPFRGS